MNLHASDDIVLVHSRCGATLHMRGEAADLLSRPAPFDQDEALLLCAGCGRLDTQEAFKIHFSGAVELRTAGRWRAVLAASDAASRDDAAFGRLTY